MKGAVLSAYRILDTLGTGGMGSVYRAEVAESSAGLDVGTSVALKVVHPNLLAQPGFFKRFMREAQVGQQVQHDNVVKTYDCDATIHEGEHHHFLVMEYVEGQTLRDLLKELQRVPEELCRHIGREVAQGLAAIHAVGVVHRDIKPENVLITEAQAIKIMDLGVAHLQEEVIRLSQTGMFVGSLEYAAPEQFQSDKGDADARADLFALGVMLYELATGQHPYRDEDMHKTLRNILDSAPRKAGEVNPQLSAFFEEVIHTLMAKDRDERFATADELLTVLEEGEAGEWWAERARALRVETKQPLRRIRVPRETALYGRDEEMAKLRRVFEKAKAGEGQVLIVEGEAGIGKTRLVDELVGALRQEGEQLNFLFGAYPPGGAATASGAFSTAYREQFGSSGLEETLQEYLAETPVLIPAFAALLRGESTPTGAEPLTKESMQTVFVHATRRLAAERPTIVLIDDLHFAPDDGRALFASLAAALHEHPVILVGTSRPGMDDDWVAELERQGHTTRISLPRLGPKDLGALLKDAFRSERLAQELGWQIAEKSDGNPFFAFEIIRGLREGQFITQSQDGTWVSTQVINQIQIPSSVMDLFQARLRDLSDEERELLDVAACSGFEFDPSLIADVVGMRRIPALRAFGRIESRHRLVRSAGQHLVFDHYQVQEVLYNAMLAQLRREYHGAIAETLEEREGAAEKDPEELDGDLCVNLCGHYLKGGRGEQAVRYLDAALDHLERGYVNEQALAMMDRALDAPGLLGGAMRADVLLRKNELLSLLGRHRDREAVLTEARDVAADEPALRTKVEIAFGAMLEAGGRYDDARKHLEALLDSLDEGADSRDEARALRALGLVLLRSGALGASLATHQRAVDLAGPLGKEFEASTVVSLGTAHLHKGEHAAALACYDRALEIGALTRASEGIARGNRGLALAGQGRYAEAFETSAQEAVRAREIGHRIHEAICQHNQADQLAVLGRTEEALASANEALRIGREVGYPHFEAATLCHIAQIFLRIGDTEAAEARVREAGQAFDEIGVRDEFAAEAALALGEILRATDREDEADAAFRKAIEIADACGVHAKRVFARLHLGDVEGAIAADAEAEGQMGYSDRIDVAFRLFKATGERSYLEAAHGLLAFVIEHAPEAYRESMVENVPLHRQIMETWGAQHA